jgi:hypothetical protein
MARKKSNYNKRKVLRTKRRGNRKRTTKRRQSRKKGGAVPQALEPTPESPESALNPQAPALGKLVSGGPNPASDSESAYLPLRSEEVPNLLSNIVQKEYDEIRVGDIIVPTEHYNKDSIPVGEGEIRNLAEAAALRSGLGEAQESEELHTAHGPVFKVMEKTSILGPSNFILGVLPVTKRLRTMLPAADIKCLWRGHMTNWATGGRRVVKLGPKAFEVMKFTWAYKGFGWSREAGVPEIIRQLTEASGTGRFAAAAGWMGGVQSNLEDQVALFGDSVILHSNQMGEVVDGIMEPPGTMGAEAHFTNSEVAAQWLSGDASVSPKWTDYKGPGGRAREAAASLFSGWRGGGSKKRTKPRKRRRRRR